MTQRLAQLLTLFLGFAIPAMAADPQVTYDVVNIDGEKPHSITVKRSELTTE